MSALAGIWNPGLSETSIRQIVQTQLQRVRVPSVPCAEYTCVYPGFGVGLQDPQILENGVQPVTTADGRTLLILDGEVHNADELRRSFRHSLVQDAASTPALCLQLIMKHGVEVVHDFNGLFCLVLYDCIAKRLTLISDHFGFRPLFYACRQRAVLFGSGLKALCAVDPDRRQIDEIGMLEYFCYGSYVMDRTWIQGYLRLPPATILTVDESGVQTHRYWTYRYEERAPVLDQPTYFTVFGTLLDRAVERCMKGSRRIGLFLSGGYDSRAIAASIRHCHRPLPAFTFGVPESRDVRYAAMLAERLGIDHYPLTDRGPYLDHYCRSIVWRTEGLASFAHCTSIRYHAILKEKMDIILLGFLAEFSGSHTWPRLLLARSRQAVINALFNRMLAGRQETLRRIFTDSFFRQTFDVLHARFVQSFDTIPNDHPLNVADCWNFTNLQPRSTFQSPSVDRPLFEARAPHMDWELVNFLLTIPPHARLEQRVYKKMIAYSFPAIRDVPCTNSGLPINPRFAREYASMVVRSLSRKAASPFVQWLNSSKPLGREFRDLGEDFRAEPQLVDGVLRPLLDAGIFPDQIFNRAGIEDLVSEHYGRKGNHEDLLSRLISWGLAAKYFLHDALSDVLADTYLP